MSEPLPEALAVLDCFRREGSIDLGPMRVDRDGPVGAVTNQNHGCLNAEDDTSTRAMEIAIDLVLLDDAIEVGVLGRSRGWRWPRALPSAAPANGYWSWTGCWPSAAPAEEVVADDEIEAAQRAG
jgi:hypothetical protein